MRPEIVVFILHTVLAALLAGLGWPLWRRRVRPNMWYGFRTPATLRDERIWYPVNETCGRGLVWTAAVLASSAMTTFVLGLPVAQALLVNSIPLVTGLLTMTLYGFLQIHRLKQQSR